MTLDQLNIDPSDFFNLEITFPQMQIPIGSIDLTIYSRSSLQKAPVSIATTGSNIALTGYFNLDGVALNNSDGIRVLVMHQTDPKQNGIYIVQSGAWYRAGDSNTYDKLFASTISVLNGSANKGKIFCSTIARTGTLGTTPITYALATSLTPVSINSDDMELKLMKADEIEVDFDDREFWAVLGTLTVQVLDNIENLRQLLCNDFNDLSATTVYWKFTPLVGDFEVFEGTLDPAQGINSDKLSGLFELKFNPKTEVLNQTPLFLNGAFNSFPGISLTTPGSSNFADSNAFYVKDLIESIYKIVDPDIAVNSYNDWIFHAFKSIPPDDTIPGYTSHYVTTFDGTDPHCDGSQGRVTFGGKVCVDLWDLVYTDHTSRPPVQRGLTSYMDLLKAIVRNIGGYTGMVSAKVAVVSPFVPGFSNLLPVAAPYVEITDEITTTWTPVGPDPQRPIFTPPNLINIDRLTQRSKLKFLQVGNTTVGVKTSIPSDGITIETISLFCNTLTYHIQASQISAPGMAQASCSNFLGQYLGQYYLSIGSCFKDKITLADICYSMLQKFHYGSTWYIPLSILRKLQENKTEINGVPFIMDANQTNVPATSVNGDYSDVAEIIQA